MNMARVREGIRATVALAFALIAGSGVFTFPSLLVGESEDEVGRLARETRRTEYRPVVFPQYRQPRADIIGMADGRHDPEFRAKKSARHFRAQFLSRIGRQIIAIERATQA